MILLIDNYDSFTYNVKHYLLDLNQKVVVFRNDKISINKIRKLKPKSIVISPGPCTPNEAGISLNIVAELSKQFPILGICLGHQTIGQAFGGKIIKCKEIMHVKVDTINHFGHTIFKNVERKFKATRYHSLVISKSSIPDCLNITAWTENKDKKMEEIMGVKHKEFQVEGVQFHPESILTDHGHQLLKNFLDT